MCRVSDPVIKGLLDDLYDKEVFNTAEKESVIQDKTNTTDWARWVIQTVINKGETASQIMIDCMKKKDKHLCITLGLIPSTAGGAE